MTRKQTQARRAQAIASRAVAALCRSYQSLVARSLPCRFELRLSTLGCLWPVMREISMSESLVRSKILDVASCRKAKVTATCRIEYARELLGEQRGDLVENGVTRFKCG